MNRKKIEKISKFLFLKMLKVNSNSKQFSKPANQSMKTKTKAKLVELANLSNFSQFLPDLVFPFVL